MADQAIEITGGSGINVDTRTESTNSNHRQVVVLGDPADNDGITGVTNGALRVTTANDVIEVGVTNTVTVTATNLDIRSLSSGSDSVTAVATNLDIRDLDSASDSVTAVATDLDIRNLASTQDTITTRPDVGSLQAGTTTITPKYKEIDLQSSGDQTLIAGVSGFKIRVLNYTVVAGLTNNTITIKSGTSSLTGDMQFASNGGVAVPYNPVGHFETGIGQTLYINSGSSFPVSGHLSYVEV